MKKRGFTLIELLAVIVVLAIIALIAVPKVTEIIEDSEKKTLKNSASNLIRTVDMYLVRTNKKYGVVDILDGNLSYSGDNFEYGQIEINKQGNSRMYAYKEGYCITKTYNGEIEVKESTQEECSGFIDEVLCKAKETVTNGNKAEGNFDYGDEYSCELGDGEENTFYVLENNEDTVSLIMNMNIGIADWCSKEDYLVAGGEDLSNDNGACQNAGYCVKNEYGPITALNYLKTNTTSWTKLNESQISLPSAEQIAKTVGQTLNNSNILTLPTWLYENIISVYGYWTSTSFDSQLVWVVSNSDGLNNNWFLGGGIIGVRPVITISKTQIK